MLTGGCNKNIETRFWQCFSLRPGAVFNFGRQMQFQLRLRDSNSTDHKDRRRRPEQACLGESSLHERASGDRQLHLKGCPPRLSALTTLASDTCVRAVAIKQRQPLIAPSLRWSFILSNCATPLNRCELRLAERRSEGDFLSHNNMGALIVDDEPQLVLVVVAVVGCRSL